VNVMKDYSEKRDFHRMQVESEIEITDSKGNTFSGTCKDLSATGMQLVVRDPVMVGEELTTVRTGGRRLLVGNQHQRSHPLVSHPLALVS
jgi:hypothetical protein